ncbi:hypothetical protein AQUCO_01700773v1 [Aquilegia coerulea]|uniref:Uncharacterized protein n=1 Tax=Aquilegia coerulea TaxID=218851 RepID=A0A2G5DPL7_AQUCA|nr:hypothetical protein AQUCO_01700773v1 [Aquilegia coerulea]
MNNLCRPPPSKWSTDLCTPGHSLTTCFLSCCLPCITFGQIAEIVDEGQTSCITQGLFYGMLMSVQCHCLLSSSYRGKLRYKFGIPGDDCGDFCVHCCCEPCALIQEHNELEIRGFDLSKGWVAHHHNVAPPAPIPLSMYK